MSEKKNDRKVGKEEKVLSHLHCNHLSLFEEVPQGFAQLRLQTTPTVKMFEIKP